MIGMTSMGGGAMMTPILITFCITIRCGVGSDIIYAAVTKLVGSAVHLKQKLWMNIVRRLAYGSPGAIIGAILSEYLHDFTPLLTVLS